MNPRVVYYLFVAFSMMGFASIATTYVPFLLAMGLHIAQISLLNVAFWVVIFIAEIPTGLFADSIGRAASLKIGLVMRISGPLIYFFARDFQMSLVAEIVEGFGFAFVNGAIQAWITDALRRRNEFKDLNRVFMNGAICGGIAGFIGGVLGALLGKYSLRSVWLLHAGFALAAFILTFFAAGEHGEPIEKLKRIKALTSSFKALRESASLWWATTAVLCFGLVVPFNHYWAPIFQNRLGDNGKLLIWTIINVCIALSAILVRKIFASNEKENEMVLISGSLFFAGIGLIGLGNIYGTAMPIVFVVIHELGRGTIDPLLEIFISRRVESGYRATYGSLHSIFGRIGIVVTLSGAWFWSRTKPSNEQTMMSVMAFCGILLCASAFILYLKRVQNRN